MKFLKLLLFIIFSSIISFGSNANRYLPLSSGEQINHTYYTLSYNENTEQANWVYYKLTAEMLKGSAERSSNFRNDPLVSTKSASTKDYTNSGFDRGHLCPAGDMKFDSDAMYESFYMSNVSPQDPGFNRGIWKSLEAQVREWAKIKDELIVVTGPIINETEQRIGTNDVSVPPYFYKIIFAEEQNQMIAFVFPNKASFLSLDKFVSTVDSLEQITGIDFFSQLSNDQENLLESKKILSGWLEVSREELADNESNRQYQLVIFIIIFGFIALFVVKKILKSRS